MDALLTHDREHARQLEPAEKLKQALDVMRAGIRLKRSTLRRQFPDAADIEVDHRWLNGYAGMTEPAPELALAAICRELLRLGRRFALVGGLAVSVG